MRHAVVINGKSYIWDAQVGQGGAGCVFKAIRESDKRPVAIKRIALTGDDKRNQRFLHEVKLGKTLNYPHIIKIIDSEIKVEESKHGTLYYVMPLYNENLRDVISKIDDYEVLFDYAIQLFEAVKDAHSERIAHRDIKPENILVDSDKRQLVLADFGIAHTDKSTLTEPMENLGNREYHAPEQVKGNAKNVREPADIFALGLILVEMFTKQKPSGSNYQTITSVFPFLSELDSLAVDMMQFNAENRIDAETAYNRIESIRADLDISIKNIKSTLYHDHAKIPQTWSEGDIDSVMEQASKDILAASSIFSQVSLTDFSKYELNYHCELHFSLKDELYNICIQNKIYEICKDKFDYESNLFSKENISASHLPITGGPSLKLINEFIRIIHHYNNNDYFNHFFGFPLAKSVKYFCACRNYHCEEILTRVREIVEPDGELNKNLKDAPILWIVRFMKEYLSMGPNGWNTQNANIIDLKHQITVDWSKSDEARQGVGKCSLSGSLFRSPTSIEEKEKVVLEELRGRYGATYWHDSELNKYNIIFEKNEYNSFKEMSLKLAKPYFIFEGDVIDVLEKSTPLWERVQLCIDSFDITHTLAMILGLREIDELP